MADKKTINTEIHTGAGSRSSADKHGCSHKDTHPHHTHKTFKTFLPWTVTEKTLVIAGRTIRMIWLVISALILIGLIIFGILFYTFNNIYDAARQAEYKSLSTLTEQTFRETGKTVIYDKNGGVLAELHNTGYQYTPISEISDAIQKTYISSEDKDFLTHNGFSVKGIGRAAVSLLKSGTVTQGGSTITQQLVKNTMLTSERTFFRKLTEIFLAVDLEKKFTKADIMEYYLNTCFYGHNCKGIYAASEYYFGKKPSEIGYGEAAMLAAISKSPSVYNPEANIDTALKERNIVLSSIYKDGLISKEDYDTFCNTGYKIREHETKEEKTSYTASFAIYCGALKLMEDDGFKFIYRFADKESQTVYEKKYHDTYLAASNKLRNGGYRIFTSIDPSAQKILQKTVDKDMLSVSAEKSDDGRYNTQAAATLIDNSTGYVTAVVGGRGTDDEYNRAFLSERQPGSSIKPVLDYGPAFDTGNYYPGRKVEDKKTKNGPKNSEGTYKGETTVREAIVESRNTVAYNTLADIGIDTGLKYLSAMRFSSLSYLDESNMAASIGGLSYGVKNCELAGAYAAIENGGEWRIPTCVIRMMNVSDGTKTTDKRAETPVYQDSTAYMLTSTMEDVIKKGTGKGLAIKDMHCAGKTGTTNSLKDGWFAGYTPYYTMTVWSGNDDGTPIEKNYGARYAGKIWKDAMTELHKGLPDREFDRPDDVAEYDGDLIAVQAQPVAEKLDRSTEIADENKKAEKALKAYEDFHIQTEDDIFKMNTYHDRAEAAISGCSDDDSRNAYLERIEAKEKTLNEEASKWGKLTKTKGQYEQEQAMKRQTREEKRRAEAEENAKLQSALNRFNGAIGMINSADTKSDTLYDALDEAEDALSELQDTEEYDSLKSQYDAASERLDSLPSEDEKGDEE